MGTLKLLDSLKGFLLAATSVAFSHDSRRLAASSNGQEAVKLWDTETRQEVLTLSGEGSQFFSLKFSSDGRCLLAVNSVGLAHLWSAPSWEEIAVAEADEKRAP
jgi:WD40 repeat protein